MKQTKKLLDYVASQDEAVLTYHTNEMKLAVHSNTSYLSESKAQSWAGGHFFLSNGADILQCYQTRYVIRHRGRTCIPIHHGARGCLHSNHSGRNGPSTASYSASNRQLDGRRSRQRQIVPKRTKAMDMRFHWLRDRECQEQFRIYWRPGKLNYADYRTKHHPGKHHQSTRRESSHHTLR